MRDLLIKGLPNAFKMIHKLESFNKGQLLDFITCYPNSRLVFHIFKQVTQSKLIFGTLLYCPLKKSVLVFRIF